MKRVLMVAVLAGLGVMVGCEEKKADSIADKTKAAANAVGDKAKEAGTAVKDAAGTAADKAKEIGNAAADKAKDVGTALKVEVQNLMDTIKTKVDTLDKGGSTLEPAKKSEFDKAMTGIKSTWADLSKKFDEVSSKSGEAMATGLAEVKEAGVKLMDNVKLTAEKFGLKN
jgi:hypothetical protein